MKVVSSELSMALFFCRCVHNAMFLSASLAQLFSDKEKEKLQKMIEEQLDKEKFTVQIQNMSISDSPVIITQSEFMRRMKEQQQLSGGGMQMFGSMPESYNLAVNSNHDLINKILSEKTKKKRVDLIKQVLDLALLSQGMLKGEDLTGFISRSVSLIK